MNEKLADNIRRMKDGEVVQYEGPEESGAEVWLKNGTYFLFSIPIYGGEPVFDSAFGKHRTEDIVERIESWT